MPAVLGATDLEALQRRVQGTTRERMLREMAETLEVLTAERLLVLVLEDLHWSDYATLDLLSFLARRRQPARLLLIGTYRPVDVIVNEHPLKGVKQELQLHGHCEELALPLLTQEGVEEYLVARFAAGEVQRPPLQKLARTIYRRTDGNPLFMVNVVGYLATQGVLGGDQERWEPQRGIEAVEGGVPENLRQMVEKQLDRLALEEQRVLEAASVAGVEFAAAAVAAALEVKVDRVEEWCEELVRRGQLLRAQGLVEWPDGTVSGRYIFIHALYQEVLYQRVSAGRRIRLHCKIGEREEQGYGTQAAEIAVELAVRFEQGRDYRRAIHYLRNAGEKAIRRCANQEAVNHLRKGLALVQTLPESAERTQQELMLQIALGRPLMAMKGWGDPEVITVYARARELCRHVDETPQLCPVLFGLCTFYISRAANETARDLGEHLLRLAQKAQEPDFLLEAHLALGHSLFWLGQLPAAHAHLEQGERLYDPRQHSSHVFLYGQDPGVGCRRWGAITLWCLGYPDQALRKSQDALAMAERLAHPFSLVSTLSLAAGLHQLRREAHAARAQAEAVLALAREQGFTQWVVVGMIQKGWALTAQGQQAEGITQIRHALATAAELKRPYFLFCLAEASGKAGQIEDALTVLQEAFAAIRPTEERVFEAELYRLKGELLLQVPVLHAQLPISR
jgi:tetratricopeptide (TPR) repeat protein